MAGKGRRSGASSSKRSKSGRSMNHGQQKRSSGSPSASSRTTSKSGNGSGSGNNRNQGQSQGSRQSGNFCSECGAPRQGGREGRGAYGEGEWGQRGGTGRYEGTYSRAEPAHRRDDERRSRNSSNRSE